MTEESNNEFAAGEKRGHLPRWQGKRGEQGILAGRGKINFRVVTVFMTSSYINKVLWRRGWHGVCSL
jgi:hypothetical protein